MAANAAHPLLPSNRADSYRIAPQPLYRVLLLLHICLIFLLLPYPCELWAKCVAMLVLCWSLIQLLRAWGGYRRLAYLTFEPDYIVLHYRDQSSCRARLGKRFLSGRVMVLGFRGDSKGVQSLILTPSGFADQTAYRQVYMRLRRGWPR